MWSIRNGFWNKVLIAIIIYVIVLLKSIIDKLIKYVGNKKNNV